MSADSPHSPHDPVPNDSAPTSTRPPTRRDAARVCAAALAGGLTCRSETATAAGPGRLTMVIDLDRCTGCHACAVACKAEHGVRLGGFRSWVSEQERGRYPLVTRDFLPRLCNQCRNSPCLKVCPTGATSRRSDGVLEIDHDRCIGCRHCMAACPYNARYFNPQRDPGDEQRRFPARTHGTVDKCDFCCRRIDAGQEPACVATCPAGARLFGDADDPGSAVARVLARSTPTALLADLGTEPSVLYLGGQPDAFRRG